VEDEKWVFGGREGFTIVGEERGKLNFHSWLLVVTFCECFEDLIYLILG
jgi:hypothetical protein